MTSAEGELSNPMNAWTPEQRLDDMDSLGVDVQVVSTNVAFYKYDQDVATTIAIARACNNEVHQMTLDHPDRFAGLATLPMQDIPAAVAELERAVVQLGLKGAMINDQVNGRTFDEPEFMPFWRAAEQMGALLFIHQARPTLVAQRTDALSPAEHHRQSRGPRGDLRLVRLRRGDGCLSEPQDLSGPRRGLYLFRHWSHGPRAGRCAPRPGCTSAEPPSAYLRRFYYDCLTHSEAALRLVIDTVGADRVVLGTDWPADMRIDWPVTWVLGLQSLTQEEKELILWKNLERLLGL